MSVTAQVHQVSRFLAREMLSPCGACLARRCYATGYTRRVMKEEDKKNVVYQYVGKNTKRADRVYVWGFALTGALGVKTFLKPEKHQVHRENQLAPFRLTFMDEQNLKAYKVACGYGFSVFLCKTESGHEVYATGLNTDSQLGYYEYPRNTGRILDYIVQPAKVELPLLAKDTTKLVDVGCGRAHTVIVTDKEGVFSLGNNAYGQCGRTIVEQENYRGSQIINRIKLDGQVSKVVCGQDHTFFLMDDGQVYSCGLGADGQTGLGHGDLTSEPTPVCGDVEGEKIVEVSSAADCVLAVSDRGDVFGWGNNEYNQLASISDELSVHIPKRLPFNHVGKVVKVAAAGSMCALVNDQGQVYVWGFGILGKGPKLETSREPTLIPEILFGKNEFHPEQKVIDIKSGMSHFAALTSTGEIFVWGRNKSATLGLGHKLDQFFPLKVHVPAEVKSVSCGVDHMVALCKAFV